MCGIAGFVQRKANSRFIHPMLDTLRKRGPDGEGIFQSKFQAKLQDWTLALGHRRLAIIDLTSGDQPIGNVDASLQLVFNGEIYNYQNLRKTLITAGYQFKSQGDSETILHLYDHLGLDSLPPLNGMFAFALWDSKLRRLVLARDRAGIKPLYYAPLPGGGLAFGSTLETVAHHPQVSRELNSEGIASFFFQDFIPPPRTAFKQVFRLEPGHFLLWENGNLGTPQCFWNLRQLRGQSVRHSEKELISDFDQKLKESVQRHLVSDVPVGVFLSGGLDSSLVAAVTQKLVQEPIRTFSIGFEDPRFDESQYSDLVSRHLDSRHVKEKVSEATLINSLDQVLDCLDEPLGDPSIVPTFILSALAGKQVKVVLGGDGGDELWGGYPTYRAYRYSLWYERIPGFLRRGFIEPFARSLPPSDGYQSFSWKVQRFALRWDDSYLARHIRWMSSTDLPDLDRLLETPFSRNQLQELTQDPAFPTDPLNSMMALDFENYMSGSVLTKVDRASMANSLEVRTPLLDNELIELSFTTPSDLKLHKKQSKYLLKKVAEKYLPDAIIYRPKRGFAIPLSTWLKGTLATRLNEILLSSPVWKNSDLRQEIFKQWWDEHQQSRVDRSKPLWNLLVLDHWYRRVLSWDLSDHPHEKLAPERTIDIQEVE